MIEQENAEGAEAKSDRLLLISLFSLLHLSRSGGATLAQIFER